MTDTTEGPTENRDATATALILDAICRIKETTDEVSSIGDALGFLSSGAPVSPLYWPLIKAVCCLEGIPMDDHKKFHQFCRRAQQVFEEEDGRESLLSFVQNAYDYTVEPTKPVFDPDLSRLCESPIETAFYDACAVVSHETGGDFHPTPQVEIGDYRVDFAIQEYEIAIELDGHDYHSSKEQRTADAKRDRTLVALGWTVLRFTGSEIWKDAAACASELHDRWSEEEVERAQRLADRE